MKRLACALLSVLMAVQGLQALRLNELVQSNTGSLMLAGDLPDSWVELYNPASYPLSLAGYRLGGSAQFRLAYEFPAGVTIDPGGCLTVACDKTGEGAHTDFRLDPEGGVLTLFAPDGRTVDRVSYPAMAQHDIPYGLTADGTWATLIAPTPGEVTNAPAGPQLPRPILSLTGGVYAEGDTATVTISVPAGLGKLRDKTRICLTTDGRIPTIADAARRLTHTLTLTATTALRVRLITLDDSAIPSPVETESYIFLPRETPLDVISLTAEPDHFLAPGLGLLAEGTDLSADPRRPLHIEYFRGGERLLAQDAEARVQGGVTRVYPQKSLAVYAGKRFGSKEFAAPLWPAKPQVAAVESLILRNGGNAFSYQRFNDQVMQDLLTLGNPDADRQGCSEAIYYLNGRFMGITDVRERSNEDYVKSNYPWIKEFDMVENYTELKRGSLDGMEELLEYCNSPDATYEGLCRRVDVDNLMANLVMRLIGGDTDWPQNNMVLWRPAGGLWRTIAKDVDRAGNWAVFSEVGDDYLDYLDRLGQSPLVALWTLMLRLPETRRMLLDRTAVALGDYMRPSVASALISDYQEACRPYYQEHMEVYFPGEGRLMFRNWRWYCLQWREQWWPTRTGAVAANLARRFELGDTVATRVYSPHFTLRLNGVALTQDDFRGHWFTGYPLEISTQGHWARWTYRLTATDGVEYEFTAEGPEYVPIIPVDAARVEILCEEAPEPSELPERDLPWDSAVSEIDEIGEDSREQVFYDLQGRKITGPHRGPVIGKGVKRLLR